VLQNLPEECRSYSRNAHLRGSAPSLWDTTLRPLTAEALAAIGRALSNYG
jgi:hypothetical protein